MLEFMRDLKRQLETGGEDRRREIILALGSNHSLRDKKLLIDLQKPLIPMRKAVSVVRRIHRRLEPQKYGLTQQHFDAIYARLPIVSALLHDVRTFLRESSEKSLFQIVAKWKNSKPSLK